MTMVFRVGILTISTKGAAGFREDTSGEAIRQILASIDVAVERYDIIPDRREQITDRLRCWSDDEGLDLIVTTGGTGLTPTDVTPEATLAVIDYAVPGLAEAMRAEGHKHTPMAMLSRAVAGVRGRTLIINLPGSPRGVRENLRAVLPVLSHALEMLRGQVGEHRSGDRPASP
jgi:molybdenum cofactor synthesis domain-containing protein